MANNTNSGAGIGLLMTPIAKFGFAGMSAVLLAVIVWQVHTSEKRFDKLLEMQSQTNSVIERNTSAIEGLAKVVHDKL